MRANTILVYKSVERLACYERMIRRLQAEVKKLEADRDDPCCSYCGWRRSMHDKHGCIVFHDGDL